MTQDTDFRGLSLSSFLSSIPRKALYKVSPVPLPSASHKTALLFFVSSPKFVAPSFPSAFWRVE